MANDWQPVLTRWCIRVQAYLGSDTLRGMSGDGEMLFIRLCLDQWQHGAACSDREFWRRVHGARCANFDTAFEEARSQFDHCAAGLIHRQVARDRDEAIAQIRAKVDAARKTNRKRWGKRSLSDRTPEQSDTLSDLSSSSSSSGEIPPTPRRRRRAAEPDRPPAPPFWKSLGFESQDAYLAWRDEKREKPPGLMALFEAARETAARGKEAT